MVEQLQALNAPAEVIAMAKAAASVPDAVDFLVFEENWDAVRVFCSLSTQWNLLAGAADVLHVGLNYGAVEVVLRFEEVPAEGWREVFQALRVMERAALPLLNERS